MIIFVRKIKKCLHVYSLPSPYIEDVGFRDEYLRKANKVH